MTHNIEDIIKKCKENYLPLFSSLFLKQPDSDSNIILIGINDENDQPKKENREIGKFSIEIYSISLDYCRTLILSHNILLNALFSKTLCLRDDLDISHSIFQSLKPILLYNNVECEPPLSQIWNNAIEYIANSEKELSIRFYNISDAIAWIFDMLIPILSIVKTYTKLETCTQLLQFFSTNDRKDAVWTVFFEDCTFYKPTLLSIQKWLYIHSSELKCQNIQIPLNYLFGRTKIKNEKLYMAIADLTTDFQSIVLSNEKSQKDEPFIITEIIYAYALIAKVFYADYKSFEPMNTSIFQHYSWLTISDTIKYLLSHQVLTQTQIKLVGEHKALCMANAASLFTNYADIIEKWGDCYNCKHKFLSYINQLQHIKDLINKETDIDEVVKEIIEQLLHSFDINRYYYSYIPYCINFIADEIRH